MKSLLVFEVFGMYVNVAICLGAVNVILVTVYFSTVYIFMQNIIMNQRILLVSLSKYEFIVIFVSHGKF